MHIGEYPDHLSGFNPLKAIGRALGSTGRAIVGAVIPGVGGAVKGVLDVAAKAPASPEKEAYLAFNSARQAQGLPPVSEQEYNAMKASGSAVANSTAAVQGAAAATPANQSVADQLLTAVLKNIQTPQATTPVATPPPVITPQAPPVVVTNTSPGGYQSAPAAAMPQWAIPAMIGGLGFLMVMMQNKSRR